MIIQTPQIKSSGAMSHGTEQAFCIVNIRYVLTGILVPDISLRIVYGNFSFLSNFMSALCKLMLYAERFQYGKASLKNF